MFTLSRRRAADALKKTDSEDEAVKPSGGSSSTMMRLYTSDDNPGLKV